MKTHTTLQTRREFLRTSVLGGALSWSVPTFLANTFSALHAQAVEEPTRASTGRDSSILVILQLAGGNDGLNTVVPYANDDYRRARPKLGVPANQILKLTDEVGLHPNLTGLKELYDAGRLSIIQGVGYPNPNRSHFRSTEIWQTASDAAKIESYGWLGRYFDNACPGSDPTIAITVGRQTPQAMNAKTPTGICLVNPQNYRFQPPGRGRPAEVNASEQLFRRLNQPESLPAAPSAERLEAEESGATISALPGPLHHPDSALAFIERTALDAQLSSDEIRAVSDRAENHSVYPASQLGDGLKLIARLIGGGMATRVFYVSQGGYDTHTNQLNTQSRLLKELGDAVKAFADDLAAQGNLSRILLMTFSEFGRRVSENASGGTDHGAAAPMFIMGDRVKAGLLGQCPSLAPADLFQGDLKFHIDFRSVYASVLETWLHARSEPILGRKFDPIELVAAR